MQPDGEIKDNDTDGVIKGKWLSEYHTHPRKTDDLS